MQMCAHTKRPYTKKTHTLLDNGLNLSILPGGLALQKL